MRGNQSGPSAPASPPCSSQAKHRWRITSDSDGSREAVGSLGADGAHELLSASHANQIDRAAIPKQRVDPEEPGEGGVPVINAKDVRPDELEQINFLGV